MRISANHTPSHGSSRANTDNHRSRIRSHTISSIYTRSVSSSSSNFEFEFAIGSDDHHQRSSTAGVEITPAEDLFYKGKILPLQPTPRLSLVKSLFFVPSASSSSSSANSRHSTCSSSSSDALMLREDKCESFRRSFVTDLEEEDDFIISPSAPMNALTTAGQSGQRSQRGQSESQTQSSSGQQSRRKSKCFSLGKLSSVFKHEPRSASGSTGSNLLNRTSASSSSARDVMRNYMKKVYEKMARGQRVSERESSAVRHSEEVGMPSDELFSGNLEMNGQGVVMSCPASIRSSPCHSGVLPKVEPVGVAETENSSEEVQSAIQGAIAHCKNSMLYNKS